MSGMMLASNFNDPLYLIVNIVAITAISFMIWIGYKLINKDKGKGGGIKVKV